MSYEKIDADILTGSYVDIDGRIHIAEPISYLHQQAALSDVREASTEVVKQLAKTPDERVEIAEKYTTMKKARKEPLAPPANPVSGGRRAIRSSPSSDLSVGFPTFSFNRRGKPGRR